MGHINHNGGLSPAAPTRCQAQQLVIVPRRAIVRCEDGKAGLVSRSRSSQPPAARSWRASRTIRTLAKYLFASVIQIPKLATRFGGHMNASFGIITLVSRSRSSQPPAARSWRASRTIRTLAKYLFASVIQIPKLATRFGGHVNANFGIITLACRDQHEEPKC